MAAAPDRFDVVVIGAGVVGLSTARLLAQRGARVAVVDRSARGGDGSRAAAGVAVPSIRLIADPAMVDFTAQGRAVLGEDLAALQAAFPSSGLTRGKGIFRPAMDAAARSALEAQAQGRQEFLGRWVSHEELVALEPALQGTPLFGAYLQESAYSVDAESYLDALLHDVSARGGVLRLSEAVLEVKSQATHVEVHTDAGVVRGERVVVAAGPWSGRLPGLAGVAVGPVRGQLISAFHPKFRMTHVLSGPVYLAPWRAGEVLVGATEEEAGFANHATPQGMLFLLATLAKLAPALREARFTQAWSGLRSATPSGRPLIGAYPGETRVFIASGHGGQGILTGGVTGRWMADLLEGKASDTVRAFDPAKVPAGPPPHR